MFKALDDYFDPTITLPVTREKSYTFQSPSAKVGLYLQKVETIVMKQRRGIDLTDEEIEQLNLDDDGEKDFYRMIMGDTFDEMVADRVPWPRFQHVAQTVFAWITKGDDAAETYWNSAAPKAPAKKTPADRRPRKAAATSAPRASTGSTTRSQPRKTTRATRGKTS